MQLMDKKQIIKMLDQVDDADEAYYNENKTIMPDPEYDGLKDTIKSFSITFKPKTEADKKFADRVEDVLTRVGAPPPKNGEWPKVKHDVPMLSLNKVNLPPELDKWASDDCNDPDLLFVTEKLDGISLSMRYDDGVFVQGATRGNGKIGEDFTRNVKKMKGVPAVLKEKFTGYIRGEVVLLHSDYKAHFPEMANARNAASGLAKRFYGKGPEHLTVLSYTIDGADNLKTEVEAIKYLKKLGFKIPNWELCKSTKEVSDIWQRYMDKDRKALDYDIDGLVVRVNNLSDQYLLGEKGNRPKGAIAFKFESPEAKTKINDIPCQVGDTGQITPVAEFNPVMLLGAKVKRASLHNFSNIEALGINRGSEIYVKRANDVIPYVSRAVKKTDMPFRAPTKCPACGARTKFEGELLFCTNSVDCPPQVIGRLNKWIKELGILEWGEKVLQKLIDANLITDVADLYKLKVQDISNLDRMGEKSAKNLIGELDKFREIRLENFLGGLCIRGVATSTIKFLIDAGYDSYDKIKAMSSEELENVQGIGELKAKDILDGLRQNKDRINDILDAGVTIKEKTIGSLTGKSFCFTGKSTLPRAKLHGLVEDNGGNVKKSVGKGLDYLVMADANSTSSKAMAARKNRTQVISEEDFMEML